MWIDRKRVFEVEILVLLLGCHTDITYRALRLQSCASISVRATNFTSPSTSRSSALGKRSCSQSAWSTKYRARRSASTVRCGPCALKRLARRIDVRIGPVVRFPRVEFPHRDVDGPASQLRRQIDLLGQVPAAFGHVVQACARRMQRSVVHAWRRSRFVPSRCGPCRNLGRERLDVGRQRSLRRDEFLPRLRHRVRIAHLGGEGFGQIDLLAEAPPRTPGAAGRSPVPPRRPARGSSPPA